MTVNKEAENKVEGEKTIDADIAHSEAMGFIHGERKEKVESTLNKVWELMKKENLSISQAKFLAQRLSEKIKREQEDLFANTTIK